MRTPPPLRARPGRLRDVERSPHTDPLATGRTPMRCPTAQDTRREPDPRAAGGGPDLRAPAAGPREPALTPRPRMPRPGPPRSHLHQGVLVHQGVLARRRVRGPEPGRRHRTGRARPGRRSGPPRSGRPLAPCCRSPEATWRSGGRRKSTAPVAHPSGNRSSTAEAMQRRYGAMPPPRRGPHEQVPAEIEPTKMLLGERGRVRGDQYRNR